MTYSLEVDGSSESSMIFTSGVVLCMYLKRQCMMGRNYHDGSHAPIGR